MTVLTSRRTLAALAVALCLPLIGCGTETSPSAGSDDEDISVSSSDSSANEPDEAPSPSLARPPGDKLGPAEMVAAATEDLVERSGVAAEAITVARNEAVTWRDGSIGCPKKGMNYTMALVPGHLVVLEADGQSYSYHSAQGRTPQYCADPQPPAENGAS